MEEIIKDIKKKKSLENLDDKLVEQLIPKEIPENKKSKKYKEIIKSRRNILNKVYGQFWLSNELKLEAHKSSKERLSFYERIYKKIFEITGKPKSILDLGAGLNPLSYKYLGCKPKYTAIELAKKDCDKLNYYFKKENINGTAVQKDLTSELNFPKADVCFMFKLLESLGEQIDYKYSEKLIKSVDCKYLIISFSTTTINNQRMNYPRRGWLEQMLKRLNMKFDKITESNEIFYVIKK